VRIGNCSRVGIGGQSGFTEVVHKLYKTSSNVTISWTDIVQHRPSLIIDDWVEAVSARRTWGPAGVTNLVDVVRDRLTQAFV
jgi:hypothetical protein